MLKNIIIVVVLIAISAGGYWYFKKMHGTPPMQAGTPSVIVIKAYQQTLYDDVEALGNTFANESVDITSNVSEVIKSINFTDGQQVKKGDVIAILEQDEESAQLKAAQATLEENIRERNRLEELVRNKAAAKRDYDERKTQVEIAQHDIEGIKAKIGDRTLTAPFDGVLGIRQVSVGTLVQPGKVITTIDDLSQIKLDFNVSDVNISQLKTGLSIEAKSEYLKGNVFKGEIQTVNSRVDPVTRSVLVRAIVPNPDGILKPGMLMKVSMLDNKRDAVVVPEEAVLQKQAKHFIIIIDPNSKSSEMREITVGVRRPGIVEVVSGLNVDEMVVVRGINTVRPGQTVEIKEVWDGIKTPDTGGI